MKSVQVILAVAFATKCLAVPMSESSNTTQMKTFGTINVDGVGPIHIISYSVNNLKVKLEFFQSLLGDIQKIRDTFFGTFLDTPHPTTCKLYIKKNIFSDLKQQNSSCDTLSYPLECHLFFEWTYTSFLALSKFLRCC